MIIDMQSRHRLRRVAKIDCGLAAPRQESGIVFATVNQFEHAVGGLSDKYGFFDQGHASGGIPESCRIDNFNGSSAA
jgi:hypothetical protein